MIDSYFARFKPAFVLIVWILSIGPFVDRMVGGDQISFLHVFRWLENALTTGVFVVGAAVIMNLLLRHALNVVTRIDGEARRSADTVADIFTTALRSEWRARRRKVTHD
jgi:hypothetical protein